MFKGGGGRFSDLAFLGEGGMGQVWSAFDQEVGERVAIKTIPAASPELLVRFKREFRWASAIHHKNLVRLLDLNTEEPQAWFTMELLDGVHLDRFVRRDLPKNTPLDWTGLTRLRACMSQLVEAICVLHDANVIHRDIKPANVMVVGDQRVVLLDLGIADHPVQLNDERRQPQLMGTAHYIPPEGWRGVYSASSDWYGLGVLLYQLLTGTTPFDGGLHQVHFQKTDPNFIRLPSDAVGMVPERLDRLVGAMLSPEPADRPDRDGILAVLGTDQPASAVWERLPVIRFVGRAPEVDRLSEALKPRPDGGPQVVVVRGPSGVGKTRLVEHALARWRQQTEGHVLHSRCHPYESVPFKALDAAVDELSRLLRQPWSSRVIQAPPRHVGELLRLFPTLIGVGRLGGEPHRQKKPPSKTWWESTLESERQPAEPVSQPTLVDPPPEAIPAGSGTEGDRRLRAFSAFRDLLDQVCAHVPLTLWIDDLQWSDADSEALLAELLTGPAPPPLRLVLCQRHEATSTAGIRVAPEGFLVAAPTAPTTVLDLAPLDAENSLALIRAVGGPDLLPPVAAQAVADAAEGSPLLIRELARSPETLGEGDLVQGAAELVQTLLTRRLDRLEPSQRRLVELVSLCGGPLPVDVSLQAAGLTAADRPVLDELADHGFLRIAATQSGAAVLPFHDRIAEGVVATLDEPESRAGHLRLLRVLEHTQDPDPEILLRHAIGAGDERRAATLALAAATRAEQALAFHRAADLYRFALDLDFGAERPRIQRALAQALAWAGRGGEAGAAYEACLALPDLADQARVLQRLAAEQYLRSGHLEAGARVLLQVLGAHGIRVPGSRRAALTSAMGHRLRFLLRGSGFERREAPELPVDDLERLDALWAASTSFAVVDHHLADAMAAQHLLSALKLGEPSRVARALGYEACSEGILPGAWFEARALRLGQEADDIARSTGRPRDLAFTMACTGTVHWSHGRWQDCAERCEATVQAYRDVGFGVDWNLGLTFMYLLSAWAWAGELERLRTESRRLLDSARARGDRFTETMCLTGQPALTWLAQDQAEQALAAADSAIAAWQGHGFHTQHYHHLIAGAQAAVYLGRPEEGRARLEAGWPELQSAMFLGIDAVKCEMWHLRGRVALACLAAGGPEPKALRATVVRSARIVSRCAMPQAPALARLLHAGLACVDGDPDQARALLVEAVPILTETGTAVYAAAARGALVGLEGSTDPWERLHLGGEVERPARLARVLVPGVRGGL